MSYITEETADAPLVTKLTNFKAASEANKTVLGLTPADITAMGTLYTAFSTAYAASENAKAAAKQAVTAKNAAKKAARANVAGWSKIWRANPAISDAILDALMLAPHNTPASTTPPTTPTNLVATVNGEGVISLKWGRNGNKPGTIFNIETSDSPSGNWTIFDSTTKAKFDYAGTPGTSVWFRIVAKRDGQSAAPTNPISVWAGGSGRSLKFAA